jgi:peptide/nickel transport system substrate-binding protein
MDKIHFLSFRRRISGVVLCSLACAGAALMLSSFLHIIGLAAAPAGQADRPADGAFVAAIVSDPSSLDPALSYDEISWLAANQMFDTLTRYQEGGSLIQPGLAVTWTISSDGLEWIFILRPGVQFHDGTPLNAAAVVENLQRWWDPAHPQHNGTFDYFFFMFGGFKGDPGCLIADVQALGQSQVRITLTQPRSDLASILAIPAMGIASPAAIQAGTLVSHPVGSGPFSFVEYIPNDHLLMQANPGYWAGAPQVDTLRFQVIADDAARLASLRSGSIHAAGDFPTDIEALALSDPELQATWRPASNIGYLGINRGHAPLDNLLVRQAIAHAINKPALIAQAYSAAHQPARSFAPPALWGLDPALTDYEYNPGLATALLAQAGYTDGLTTTLAYRPVYRLYLPDPAAAASAIQADLAAVGIHVTVTEYESSLFLDKFSAGELDLFLLGWFVDHLHPDNVYSWHLCNDDVQAFGPRDPAVCSLLQQALAEPDFPDQVALYEAVSRSVHDTLPMVPLVHARKNLVLAVNAAGLTGSPMSVESYAGAYFVQAAQAPASPAAGGSVVFTDTQSLTTTIEVPAGALTDSVILRYEEIIPQAVPPGLGSAGHAFDLSAQQGGNPLPGLYLLQPAPVTIGYSDADVAGLSEDTLFLAVWNGSAWVDAAGTCSPPSTVQRDLTGNRIRVSACRLGQFALLGDQQPTIFLPVVIRLGP